MDIPAVVEQLDMRYLIDTLVDIAQVPTDVTLGPNVFMAPDDPKLLHYVQHILRPKLTALGVYDLMDVPENQFVARYGCVQYWQTQYPAALTLNLEPSIWKDYPGSLS